MQVHGPDTTVKAVGTGEYHLGTVAIYLGPIRVVTYSEEDCDAIIAAACKAKEMHATALVRPGPAAPGLATWAGVRPGMVEDLRAKLAGLALPDEDEPVSGEALAEHDARESGHIAIEGTV